MKCKFLRSRKVSFNKIEKLWKNNKAPIQLYIHSPFCKTHCKFCIYNGGIFCSSKDKDLYNNYFNTYLPNQIDKYSEIIHTQNIHGIYFGGGTSNIEEDLASLNPVFERTRDINCVERTIELHFGLPITDKTIEKLAQEKINTVILCIQTLDEDKTKEQCRPICKDNNLDEIIGKLHKKNINVGIDLIIFKDGNFNRIAEDIEKFMSLKNKPDTITASYEIDLVSISYKSYEFLTDEIKNKILCLAGSYYKMRFKHNCIDFVAPDKVDIFENSFYSFRRYEAAEPSYITPLIGIGSLRSEGHRSYSRIGPYVYLENYNKGNPNYTLYKIPPAKRYIKRAIRRLKIDPVMYQTSYIEIKLRYNSPEHTKEYKITEPSVMIKYKKY